MEVCGEREPRNDENCETENTKLIYNVIDKDCGIIIMYINADGLLNRLDEQKSRIHACKVKPSIIGFISIRRYRDIDRGDLAFIAAPRDRTISCALLPRHKPSSQQYLHDRA